MTHFDPIILLFTGIAIGWFLTMMARQAKEADAYCRGYAAALRDVDGWMSGKEKKDGR